MKIAVVGSGVSGLVAAWLLGRGHDVTLFEAEDRLGGHVHTHDVSQGGARHAVDSGFIVLNDRNYPGLVRLLDRLGVATQPSTMSFSVQVEASGLEWNGTNFKTLFAQRRNLVRPSFWRMLGEVLRFHREARALLAAPDDGETLGAWLARRRFARVLVDDYLVPMGASIWSTAAARLADFPARPLASFLENHGMLQVEGRPQWRVIRGGSRTYVDRIVATFRGELRRACPVQSLRRTGDAVVVASARGAERFDAVVVAVHADQALAMLDDATADERRILGAFPYARNAAVLHTDPRLLPRTRRAWAAWNYFAPRVPRDAVTITYDASILQSLQAPRDYLVTLNRSEAIDPASVLARMTYHHPQYTVAGFAAQREWAAISGVARVHYCGAYWGFGFHEDGVQSALRVAERLGCGFAA